MSHYLAKTSPGEPLGYHDIDTEIDSGTLEHLPHGLMEHHAFQPHMWRAGDPVDVTTTDGRRYPGRALEVSNATGKVLIQLEAIPRNHGRESMPEHRMVS
jgi:hypothetical protein